MAYDEKLAGQIIDDQAAEIERLRAALEQIRWLEGVNPSVYKIARDALRVEQAEDKR